MLYVLQEAGVENHFYEGLVRRRPGLQPWLVADFCFIRWLMRTLSGTDTIANVPSVNIHGVVDDSPPFRLLMIQVLYINCFMTIITKEKQFKSSIIHKLLLKCYKQSTFDHVVVQPLKQMLVFFCLLKPVWSFSVTFFNYQDCHPCNSFDGGGQGNHW